MGLPSITIVLLSWNNHEDTLSCVHQIKHLDYPTELINIVVVDNHSSEFSRDILTTNSHLYHLILLDANVGFAAGNNIGIRYALKIGSSYIWILNSDINFSSDILKQLLVVFQEKQNAGIVSPKIQFADPPGRLWYAGGIKRHFSVGFIVGYNQVEHGQFDQMTTVDFGVGCSMLISSEVFKKVGEFDEKFFFYHEDVDFCLRAQKAGYEIWYQPAGLIIHQVSSSTKSQPALKYFLSASARIYFFKKHTRRIAWPVQFIIEAFRLLRLCISQGLKGNWANISAYFHGLVEGLKVCLIN